MRGPRRADTLWLLIVALALDTSTRPLPYVSRCRFLNVPHEATVAVRALPFLLQVCGGLRRSPSCCTAVQVRLAAPALAGAPLLSAALCSSVYSASGTSPETQQTDANAESAATRKQTDGPDAQASAEASACSTLCIALVSAAMGTTCGLVAASLAFCKCSPLRKYCFVDRRLNVTFAANNPGKTAETAAESERSAAKKPAFTDDAVTSAATSGVRETARNLKDSIGTRGCSSLSNISRRTAPTAAFASTSSATKRRKRLPALSLGMGKGRMAIRTPSSSAKKGKTLVISLKKPKRRSASNVRANSPVTAARVSKSLSAPSMLGSSGISSFSRSRQSGSFASTRRTPITAAPQKFRTDAKYGSVPPAAARNALNPRAGLDIRRSGSRISNRTWVLTYSGLGGTNSRTASARSAASHTNAVQRSSRTGVQNQR